jgi:phosphatidylglycerol---prolipoprotein diacylglyceryl transferase
MLAYPAIDPIAFHIGPWPVHWYGLMYLVGFVLGWGCLALRLKCAKRKTMTQEQLSDVVFATALGAILGGRIGYMLFYDLHNFLHNPLLLFQTWKGGMSFHGGLLVAPVVPLGLAAGRIGNFINGELWGKVTTVPWGMVFPTGGPLPRHPSQLYEFALEGVMLFIILWCYSSKPRPIGAVSGLFAICYGLFRCFAEFYRMPDAPIGYLAFGWVTEGQLLSLPLILVGIMLMVFAYKRGRV